MSRELEALKHELDRRMYDLAKMSGTSKQRAEVYRTLQVIRHIESLHSCPNCKHWDGERCDRFEIEYIYGEACSRHCVDFFEPRWEDGNE